jgi:hypothetical protein
MSTTTRLKIPLMQPGQLAKETTHNEALARIDALIGGAVREVGRDTPPEAPAPGDCYIVGDVPNGDWVGRGQALASYTESGWRFVAATAGMSVLDLPTGCVAQFDGTDWSIGDVRGTRVSVGGLQVLGSQQPAIANHASDATVNAILAALRAHGLIAA